MVEAAQGYVWQSKLCSRAGRSRFEGSWMHIFVILNGPQMLSSIKSKSSFIFKRVFLSAIKTVEEYHMPISKK
jgi:hypothetical protein